METRTIVQDRHPEPHRIRKELWKLALSGGAAFWIVDFAMALSPIGEAYRDAFSISNLPLALVEALAGGLMVACIVSYLLLRFAGRIPFKNPISKGLILSLAAMLLVEALSTLVDPVHAIYFPLHRYGHEPAALPRAGHRHWIWIYFNQERQAPMNAILCTKYGSPDVLRLKEVSKPAPLEDEVLVRIHATSINARDWRMMRAIPFFIRLMPGSFWRPRNRILGADLAGRVEAIGRNIRQFKPGDEVFGYLPSKTGRGTFAEYVCAREDLIALKPANLTFEQAAAAPLAAVTALQGLRNAGNIQPGQKVLIQGASGGVGTFAVQIAKAFGAEVTGVCSTRNLEMVRSLGADHVIDYKNEDFTKNGQQYDLIMAVNGYHPISDYLRALKPQGTYVVAGGSMRQLMQASIQSRKNLPAGSPQIAVLILKQDKSDLRLITDLIESGKIMPIIDACYPLERTPEAFQQYEREHPRGKIVIKIV